ncbi:4447_t:CDS:2, partial [Rhizophagus irregularis]
MASEIDLLRQENARLMADEFKAKYNEAKDSLDVCLEKIIRSCDPLAVKMGTPTFSHLYEKLCDALLSRASEKQVDPESNTVSKILNKEVKAQLPAGTSDVLLQKRIEQVKKLYTLFNAI